MTLEDRFRLRLRSHRLEQDGGGHACWQAVVEAEELPVARTAIIICDMWDQHWSRGAAERVDAMAPRLNRVIAAARDRGALIIHAPSDTLDFYAASQARQRMLALPPVTPPPSVDRAVPPLPIDDADGGSDTGEIEVHYPWTRQHPAIEIDEAVDLISDQGVEAYAALQHYGIERVLIMGVHTNMCVLNRSFAIKQLVRWSVPVALVRDLTDAMYNPAKRPYVSHDEGTQLVIGYIERFWCPSVVSGDLATE